MPFHQELIAKGKMQLIALKPQALQLSQFIRESPIVSGAAIGGTVLGGGLLIAQQIRKRTTKRRVSRKPTITRRRARTRPHRHLHKPRKHSVSTVHKHRRKGLDIIHKGKKRGISLKAIRASIASPKTPEPLKRGLRKLLKRHGR